MAKEKTFGQRIKLLREKVARRISRLEIAASSKSASNRTKKEAKKKIRQLKNAEQSTRIYNPKTGKKYKKTTSYLRRAESRLEKYVGEVPARYTVESDPFEVTQKELNQASVKAPSVYTQSEVKIFYRATQKIWQIEGVSEHDRNEAILVHYNSIRRANGLSELSLEDVVSLVLKANELAIKAQETDPSEAMTDEQREEYEKAQQGDNADSEKGSPPGITKTVIDNIKDSMESFINEPKISEILKD